MSDFLYGGNIITALNPPECLYVADFKYGDLLWVELHKDASKDNPYLSKGHYYSKFNVKYNPRSKEEGQKMKEKELYIEFDIK